MYRKPIRTLTLVAVALLGLLVSACGGTSEKADAQAGGTAPQTPGSEGASGAGDVSGESLNIDFATYNPLSLIIKDQGWLEAKGLKVNWVQSAGSNKANEALRSGAIDVGSTAGSAALLARSNGSPIQVIGIYSKPEWAALVVPEGSSITKVADLKGKNVAATVGTDPYFFLLQALETAGLTADDVSIQNLQHADGWAALQNGSVEAWAGLDPIMAGAEQKGAKLVYRNVDFNTYGFLNATETFIAEKPAVAQLVIDAYEKARTWAVEHPEETAKILAEVAAIDPAVAKKVIDERSNLDVDGVPGTTQVTVLEKVAPVFVKLGNVASQDQVDEALESIVNDTFATKADASRA